MPESSTNVPASDADSRIALPSLTSLRWIAALLVFGYHLHVVEFFGPAETGSALLHWTFGAGAVGVSFFFILSGFVLMWSSPAPRARQFWWRRVARVYPLHLATAGIVVLLLAIGPLAGKPSAAVTAANLLLVQSWSPDIDYVQSLNTVSWTLSCEAFFYLAFPFIAAMVTRMRARHVTMLAVAAMSTTILGPALGQLPASHAATTWFFHWNPLGRLPEFVLGVTLAALVRAYHRHGRQAPAGLWIWALTTATIGYAVVPLVPDPYRYAACTAPGFALIIAAVAADDLARRPTPLRNRALIHLGELSFAFYLIHLIVIRIAETIIGYHPRLNDTAATTLTLATFAICLTAAALLHHWVEQPARTLLLRLRPGNVVQRPAASTERPKPASPAR